MTDLFALSLIELNYMTFLYSNFTGFVDSTTFPQRPTPPSIMNSDLFSLHEELLHGKNILQNHKQNIWALFQFPPDPDRVTAMLSTSIFDAHTRTCILSNEQIQEICGGGVDQNKIFAFKTMVS